MVIFCPGLRAQSLPIQFTDVTQKAGITFKHVDGRSGRRYFVETIGSGCGFVDYDNDGDVDIYLVNSADLPGFVSEIPPTDALYRNNGDETFTDVSRAAGVAHPGYNTGIAAGDYDNDGYLDLYITSFGPNVLFHNNGDGTFTDVAKEAGVDDTRWNAGGAFGDYDNDGYLDLYVVAYCEFSFENHPRCYQQGVEVYCGPEEFNGIPDVLYHNNGDGTFTDVTRQAGIYNPGGKGLGAVWVDYDNDGDLDIFVGNDGTENFLYQNNADGTFENVAWLAGVGSDEHGNMQGTMGIDFNDYDHDGQLDLIITNFQRQLTALYHNDGDGFFTDVSFVAGFGHTLRYVSWGTGFIDFDNDTHRDIFIANGHIQDQVEQYDASSTSLQPNQLLVGNGAGKFVDVSSEAGPYFQQLKASRGVAFGDYDNDGDIDVLVSNANDRPDFLRNDSPNRNHWLMVKTIGTKSNRDGIGARVRVTTPDVTQVAEVHSASSYISQNDMRVHFGLGVADTIEQVEVRWPSGTIDVYMGVQVDQVMHCTEGETEVSESR